MYMVEVAAKAGQWRWRICERTVEFRLCDCSLSLDLL